MKKNHDLEILLDFLVRLVESTKGTIYTKKTAWLKDTQPLAAKLFMHCGSVYHLAQGSKVNNILKGEINYVDHHSIIVLVRAIHELFLAFNYLFVAPTSNELRVFRHSIWELGAFFDRQKFRITFEETKKKQTTEKLIVIELTDVVQNHNLFNSLNKSEKQKALKGEWRLNYSWADLAEFANLDKEQFTATYRYLCSYAHTGYLSIFQMQFGSDDAYPLGDVWIDTTMGIISNFIYDYIKIYPQAAGLFKQYPEAAKLVYINDGLLRGK